MNSCDLGDKSYLCSHKLDWQVSTPNLLNQETFQPAEHAPQAAQELGVRGARSEEREGLHLGPGTLVILWERWVSLLCQERDSMAEGLVPRFWVAQGLGEEGDIYL